MRGPGHCSWTRLPDIGWHIGAVSTLRVRKDMIEGQVEVLEAADKARNGPWALEGQLLESDMR